MCSVSPTAGGLSPASGQTCSAFVSLTVFPSFAGFGLVACGIFEHTSGAGLMRRAPFKLGDELADDAPRASRHPFTKGRFDPGTLRFFLPRRSFRSGEAPHGQHRGRTDAEG